MDNNIMDTVNKILKTPQGAEIYKKRNEFASLAESREGKKVKELLQKDSVSLSDALERSDTEQLKKSLMHILSTDEGARLMKQINNILK